MSPKHHDVNVSTANPNINTNLIILSKKLRNIP